MKRRTLLKVTPAGIVALLFARGAAAAPAPMTIQEQIANHRDELFRLLAAKVPEGTELNIASVMGGKNMDFIHISAKRPDWSGDHFYVRNERGGPWIKRLPKGGAK